MYLSQAVEAYVNILKAYPLLSGNYIIAAYPDAYIPNPSDKAVIAVSPAGIDCKAVGIGNNVYHGEFRIRVDVYMSNNQSPCVSAVMGNVINAIAAVYPCKVEAGEIISSDSSSCYRTHCVFTYKGKLEYGGTDG
ncbi:MAG: hypothetical protein E7571_01660 [Ruminococcaceae bacterium]|nr:hypothetical protein [Oscillospiraceae bacterium]